MKSLSSMFVALSRTRTRPTSISTFPQAAYSPWTTTTSSSNSSIYPQNHHQVRFATKKAGGSTSNNRDSAGRRLGIKAWPRTHVSAGSIIVRQRGQKFFAGENVGMGKDHTIFAKVDGIVKFTKLFRPHKSKRKLKNVVHVEMV